MTVTPASQTHRMRGVFVLFEGLLPTVIDSQVLTHVRLVREMLDIDIPVVAFACTADVYEHSRAAFDHAWKTAGGDVHLFRGIRPALPGSAVHNRLRLSGALDRLGGISFVHARGDYAAAVAGPLAQSRALPMLWDCRGDSRAELHERIGISSPLQRLPLALRAWMSQQDSKTAGGTCAAACFVSQSLRELMMGYIGAKPSWVLPCLANENEFFFDPASRQRMREKLGFADSDPVYAYSGSLAGYQLFDEMVDAFRVATQSNPAARLLVLTPYVEAAQKKLAPLQADRVVCKAVINSEMNSYLNAADFGFLLRDDTPVNRVAFPTKFAEYALAGLKIIMKQSPPSCVSAARALGNYVAHTDANQAYTSQLAERAAIAEAAKEKMGRRASIQRFSEIYQQLAVLSPLSGR